MNSAVAENSYRLRPWPFPGKHHAAPFTVPALMLEPDTGAINLFLNNVVTFWYSMFLMVTSILLLLILNLKSNLCILLSWAHWKPFFLLYLPPPQQGFLPNVCYSFFSYICQPHEQKWIFSLEKVISYIYPRQDEVKVVTLAFWASKE